MHGCVVCDMGALNSDAGALNSDAVQRELVLPAEGI